MPTVIERASHLFDDASNPAHGFDDTEGRLEEAVWEDYQACVNKFGDLSAEEADARFFEWRSMRLGHQIVANSDIEQLR